MSQLEEIKQKYVESIYLKKYFNQQYFDKTCTDEKVHTFWNTIHKLRLWKKMEDRIETLEGGLKDKNKIKSFFGKDKFKHENKVYDTLSEIFFSAYFVEKFKDKVELEKSTNGEKNCDIYVDLRWKQYEGQELDEYYVEIKTIRDTETDNSGNQIIKGKTLDKLGEKNSDGTIKESQFIDGKKNILLIVDLHSKTHPYDSHAVTHGSSDKIIWTEGKDENGHLIITEPQIEYNNDSIVGDEFQRDQKLSLIGHLGSSGKIYSFDDETFWLASNPSSRNAISNIEKKCLFEGTKAKFYTGGVQKIGDGNDFLSGKLFADMTKSITEDFCKKIKNFLSD